MVSNVTRSSCFKDKVLQNILNNLWQKSLNDLDPDLLNLKSIEFAKMLNEHNSNRKSTLSQLFLFISLKE